MRSEVISQWVVNEYPQREYPAVAIGSSCGALVHLYAALGIPWLPQTYLIPVAHPDFEPNDIQPFLEWGIKHAPNGESPEAEWGFAAALRDDVERFALSRGYKVQRLRGRQKL